MCHDDGATQWPKSCSAGTLFASHIWSALKITLMSKFIKTRAQSSRSPGGSRRGKIGQLDPIALAGAAHASNNAPAWSDLGVAYTQAGDYDKAKDAFAKAITLDEERGATYFNLGNLELANGFIATAISQYEVAATKSPDDDNIYLNMGNALRKIGRLMDAESAYKHALSLNRKNLITSVNLGNLFLEMSRLTEAIDLYKSILDTEAASLGALIGLGSAYCQLKRYGDAELTLKRAITIAPDSEEAHCNLSHVYLATDMPEQAYRHARKALSLRPGFAEALSNLGLAQRDMGDLNGAIESLSEAVRTKDNFTPALANLAIVLKANGQLREALSIYRQAMASAPDDPVPAYNASLLLLQLGEFEYGWPLYENRWEAPSFDSTPIKTTRPKWRGERTDKRVLIWPEQGIGDVVMFAALFPQLQKVAPNIRAVIDPRLIRIFTRSFPNIEFISTKTRIDENSFDLHLPIGSLPMIFCQTLESFQNISPSYLKPDFDRVKYFRQNLTVSGKKLCGISWKSYNKKLGKQRSINLSTLLNLAMTTDVIFINLQYGDTEEDISQIEDKNWPLVDLKDIDKTNDIDGLCALIAACDYVVSIDNSTVHLAGALGVPTTVLLPGDRDWRWTEHTNRSLWYPATTYTN